MYDNILLQITGATYIDDEVLNDVGDFLRGEMMAITCLSFDFDCRVDIKTVHLRQNLAEVLLDVEFILWMPLGEV